MQNGMNVSITLPMVFGDDSLVDGVERAAAAGADGIEFFDLDGADAESIAAATADHGVEVASTVAIGGGGNVGHEDDPAMTNPEAADTVVDDLRRSIAEAAELGASSLIVAVGLEQEHLDRDTQREAVVDVLCRVAPDAETAGITLVLEPLNTAVDHPGYYLQSSSEGFEIVEAVDSPNVKLLYDVYHQQVTEGDLIETVTEHVDLIGHLHVADVPGRHEPGTGEINYRNVLAAIDDAGYDGFVGLEFVPSDDPMAAARDSVELVTEIG